MATEPTPTDAEIVELLGDPRYSSIAAVREALARWGAQPAPAASQKPLTDERIDALWASQKLNVPQILNRRALARAVEAAHGIGIKGGRNVDHPV